MSALPPILNGARARAWVWWIVPAVTLAALLGWETDWGRQIVRTPPAPQPVEPKPFVATVLPEYQIEGGLAANAETVNRTLFNATRRPAPTLAGDGGPRTLKPGQFQLMGTTVTGDRNIAFLKEIAVGKSRVVRQGDQINGMLVASVEPDRVKFALGDESEELVLKVAPGPKTTIAVAPPVPGAAVAATPPAAVSAAATGVHPAGAGTAAQTPQQIRQARRAAREAAAAGQGVHDAGSGSTGDSSSLGANEGGRRGRH